MQVHTELETQIHAILLKAANRGELRVRWSRLTHIVNINLISEFIIL